MNLVFILEARNVVTGALNGPEKNYFKTFIVTTTEPKKMSLQKYEVVVMKVLYYDCTTLFCPQINKTPKSVSMFC